MDKNEVRSTARHATHLQFDINANALEIRAVHSPNCIVWCDVDCTLLGKGLNSLHKLEYSLWFVFILNL
jgi:hypothetical protein